MPIKDCIHNYTSAHFNDIPGSGRTLTTYPGRDALLRHTCVEVDKEISEKTKIELGLMPHGESDTFERLMEMT